jgi:hypothetical protein
LTLVCALQISYSPPVFESISGCRPGATVTETIDCERQGGPLEMPPSPLVEFFVRLELFALSFPSQLSLSLATRIRLLSLVRWSGLPDAGWL